MSLCGVWLTGAMASTSPALLGMLSTSKTCFFSVVASNISSWTLVFTSHSCTGFSNLIAVFPWKYCNQQGLKLLKPKVFIAAYGKLSQVRVIFRLISFFSCHRAVDGLQTYVIMHLFAAVKAQDQGRATEWLELLKKTINTS